MLAIRSVEADGAGHTNGVLEAFRLAAILYVSALRARFGVDTLSGDPQYVMKLHGLLSTSLIEEVPPVLLAWILSIAFTSPCPSGQRNWISNIFQALLVDMEITNFEQLRATIERVVWDEIFLDSRSRFLQALFEPEQLSIIALNSNVA